MKLACPQLKLGCHQCQQPDRALANRTIGTRACQRWWHLWRWNSSYPRRFSRLQRHTDWDRCSPCNCDLAWTLRTMRRHRCRSCTIVVDDHESLACTTNHKENLKNREENQCRNQKEIARNLGEIAMWCVGTGSPASCDAFSDRQPKQ